MLALFLGAGFSKWAANLPLASELFDSAIESYGPREEQRLSRVRDLKGAWDAQNPAGPAEQFIAEVMLSGDTSNQEDVVWYVTRRLSDPYIWQEWTWGRVRRQVLMIDENRKWTRPGIKAAADFISRCGLQLSGIVTLNYDLIVEYALGSRGFNYGIRDEILLGRGPYPVSTLRNPVRLTGRIPFAKLHGSISWDLVGKYTDGRRGLSGKALIVPPTSEKSTPSQLDKHWALSLSVLGWSSRLLILGSGLMNTTKRCSRI
jgi:hypothetical protein